MDAEMMPVPFLRSKVTRLIAEGLGATVLAAGLSMGVVVPRAPRQLETSKPRLVCLTVKFRKSSTAMFVTKVLESGDKKYGILVFGAVYINTSTEEFAACYRDVRGLLEDAVHLGVQEFSGSVSPPKLSDFDRLTFRRKDIDAIEKCKLHRCDFQVFAVTTFQKQINWNSSDKYEQVNAGPPACSGRRDEIHLRGAKGIGQLYRPRQPFNLYQNMESMLDSSYYLREDNRTRR
jgi:hypothetical protein